MNKNDILDRVYKSDLPSRAKQIMFYLINRANSEGTCFPSNRTIASDCGISIRTVQRTIKILLEEGFIKKESRFRDKGGQTSNLFILQIKEDDDRDNKKEIEVKEEINANKMTDKSVAESSNSLEEIEIVTFLDYEQENEILEIVKQPGNDKNEKQGIEKNNSLNKESIEGDKLSYESSFCHPFLKHLYKNSYCNKLGLKLKDLLCHRLGDILYPP